MPNLARGCTVPGGLLSPGVHCPRGPLSLGCAVPEGRRTRPRRWLTTEVLDDDAVRALFALVQQTTGDDERVADTRDDADHPDEGPQRAGVEQVVDGRHPVPIRGTHPHGGRVAAVVETVEVTGAEMTV